MKEYKREKVLHDGERLCVAVSFDPRDIWVGVYWVKPGMTIDMLSIYICLIPMLPIEITFEVPK